MAGISKRTRGSWVSSNHGVMKTDTDTITTLPAELYPNDTTATVGMKGNTVQSTTPTTQNPVMQNGTGERTENLFNVNRQASNTWTIDDKYYIDGVVGDSKSSIRPDTVDASISNSGDLTVTARSYYGAGFVVAVTPNTTYTLSFAKDTVVPNSKSIATITYVDADENYLNYVTVYGGTTQVTFTTPNTAYYILIAFRYINDTLTYSDIMLNTGSIALPYEPYGYKIPISSANTTTPVYLGEVQSARWIKKLVLTGKEIGITKRTSPENSYYISIGGNGWSDSTVGYGISSHFVRNGTVATLIDGEFYVGSTAFSFRIDDCADTTAFKQYLAAQYANGTPVTVWYVLTTEETAVVNEPLMRIGDYADEVSGISIPVTAGGDTISVDTTVQPSEVTVHYKGWHPAIVHERTNGAWT